MTATKHNTATKPLSATNFNLQLLYLVMPEINSSLNLAETHLTQFYEDPEQSALLLESIETFKQLSSVLRLISLTGVSRLAIQLAAGLYKIRSVEGDIDEELMLTVSEGIITLKRYVEFVLLKETVEPTLLLPVMNRLSHLIGHGKVDKNLISLKDYSYISIADPEAHYQSLQSLGIDVQPLLFAYRAGLSVALANQDGNPSADDIEKLTAMHDACVAAADNANTLFWNAAKAVTYDIVRVLPLDALQKRTLIFVEQQFSDSISANDSRFADLVSFACRCYNEHADIVRQQIDDKELSDELSEQMQYYLFGPDHDVYNTLNDLIQNEIDSIKQKVDRFVFGETENPAELDAADISDRLDSLASIMSLCNLDESTQALHKAASEVKSWKNPKSKDFDKLLSSLTIAENSAVYLMKSHTPGAVTHPLHNSKISVYQLDKAYETIVKQSRSMISNAEHIINEYVEDEGDTAVNLDEIPNIIKQVAGAVLFLGLNDGYTMLNRLSKYMTTYLENADNDLDEQSLSYIADILLSIDYYLNGYEQSQPVSKRVLQLGHNSLAKLLAA